MKLHDYLKKRGKLTELAVAINISIPIVCFWSKGKRQIPAARCPAIEEATGGLVTCEEMRPDVNWSVLRNSKK